MKKNYTINIPVFKFWTIVLPFSILLMALGTISGIFIVDRIIMPNLPGINNRGIVKVPIIEGLEKEDARQKLYKTGLRFYVQEVEYSDSISRNIIIMQQPKASVKVKKGRHVSVILSNGAEADTIPTIAKFSERAGRNLLRSKGFGNVVVQKIFHNSIEKGHVLFTEPNAGVVTSREVKVRMFLSKGPRPTHVVMPSLVGVLLSQAKEELEEAGLVCGTIMHSFESASNPGTVVSQSISPGKQVPFEEKIDLIISAKR